MHLRKFISFGKLLALLLLISYTAVAKPTVSKNELPEKGALNLSKTEHCHAEPVEAHKNMLQPQVVHLSTGSEDSVKPITSAYVALPFYGTASFSLQATGQANQILQDADRCESVSKLLFPFHYFW